MRYAKSMPYVLLAALLVAPAASARTWTVGVPGTIGVDFREIQPAVDAAAPGDTILIGAGRYQQLHTFVAPYWTEETIVAVTKDNLTFIGAGEGATVLGKTSYYAPEGRFPMVICSVGAYTVTIEGLTIENVYQGVYWWQGTLNIRNCRFRSLATGVVCWVDSGLIEDCHFELGNDGTSILTELTQSLEVRRCDFVGFGQGFTTGASARNVNFTDCVFRDNRVAVVYDRWSTGTIRNCDILDPLSAGMVIHYNSEVTLDSVRFVGGPYGLAVNGGSVVHGTGVVLEGASVEALSIATEARVLLNGSHILPASGVAIRTYGYYGAPVVLDLSHNYWGTTDAAVIDGMILDSNDDQSVHCTVQYLPFANGPVPTEPTSWGDLKASFR